MFLLGISWFIFFPGVTSVGHAGQTVRGVHPTLFARAYPQTLLELLGGHPSRLCLCRRAGRGKKVSRPTPNGFLSMTCHTDRLSQRRRFTCIRDSGTRGGPSTTANPHLQALFDTRATLQMREFSTCTHARVSYTSRFLARGVTFRRASASMLRRRPS